MQQILEVNALLQYSFIVIIRVNDRSILYLDGKVEVLKSTPLIFLPTVIVRDFSDRIITRHYNFNKCFTFVLHKPGQRN